MPPGPVAGAPPHFQCRGPGHRWHWIRFVGARWASWWSSRGGSVRLKGPSKVRDDEPGHVAQREASCPWHGICKTPAAGSV